MNDKHYGISPKKRKEMVVRYYLNQIPLECKPDMLGALNLSDDEATLLGKMLDDSYNCLIKQNK
ncbi:MAG: hypothetical protein ACP5PX_06940, partial [Candidatus Hadarchaeum sp.]|uniref:hypothetical protein n=1 Tax=Candidatus Hadarchaeum sp. TaxID=2883567 RepID=UPI003D09676D